MVWPAGEIGHPAPPAARRGPFGKRRRVPSARSARRAPRGPMGAGMIHAPAHASGPAGKRERFVLARAAGPVGRRGMWLAYVVS